MNDRGPEIAAGMSLTAGDRLGPYEILAPLGAGGMGEVYRGRDPRLRREVAIKIVSDRIANDPESLGRFEQEARAVAALSHPNILAIHDFNTDGKISFAVTELLHGETLRDRLARERLSWRKAVEIAAAVADGLASAHGLGIVHRDLKPANIFLTKDGQVKILDFGLAEYEPSVGREGSQVETARLGAVTAGTIGYMAPEQVTGAPVDARSDIFALGCILYEMISGNRAFLRSSTGETLAAILRDEPADLSGSTRTFPVAIANVIRRCLQKSPDERFQSARDLSFALREIPGTSEVAGSAIPSRRSAFALSIAAFVSLAVIGGWLAIRSDRAPKVSEVTSATIRSLAVLPLTNLSGDPAQEYVADGITEQLIADLARLSGIRVTSQTSSMSFKGVKKPLPQIARALGVDGIVEGSVVRSGDRIKITTELIDANNDRHLWGETYERDVKDILSLQREIARAVATNISVQLTPQARSHLEDRRPIDPRSFDALIRGRYSFNKGSRDDLFRAVDQFQQALDADPTNAEAYAGLSETYAMIGYWNYQAPRDSFPKAKASALRALEMDPDSAQAHSALGYIHLYYDWDFAGAEEEFTKAIALNENLASAHRYYAIYLAAMLRPTESRREAAAARTLDPLSVAIATDSGFVMYYERDYANATKTLQDAIAMNPKAPGPHFWLGRVYQALGRYDEAAAEYKAAESGISKLPALFAGLGHMDAVTGKRAEAEQVLKQIDAMGKSGYVSPYAPALVYLGLGDKEKTLALLTRCLDERTNWMVWLLKDPRWDPMRSDPRFQEIVRKVGFPEDARDRARHGMALSGNAHAGVTVTHRFTDRVL